MERTLALATSHVQADGTHYELLMELSHGRLGSLQLARATARNAARQLVLRQVSSELVAPLQPSVRRASGVAHPRWLKTVGLVTTDGAAYVASEYVAGLPLVDLLRVMRTVELSMVPEVALRITLDALHAVSAARTVLGRHDEHGTLRYLYADSTWVATFGETLLAEPGIAQVVARANAGVTTPEGGAADCTWQSPEERAGHGPSDASDVFAAGGMLWELLSGRSLPAPREGSSSAPLPRQGNAERSGRRLLPPIVELITRALSPDVRTRFADVDDMADAIESLPARWLGTDAQVQAAIEPLVHLASGKCAEDDFDSQLNSGQHAIDPWETPTRSMRMPFASDIEPKSSLPTLRPPRSA